MLFTEVDFLDRFDAAAAAGFTGVECQFPYAYPAERMAEALARHRLTLVLHNLPPGDFASGERGIACLPGRTGEFQDGIDQAIEYATAIGCRQLNCLAGILPEGVNPDDARETLVGNLRFAAEELGAAGIRLIARLITLRRELDQATAGPRSTLPSNRTRRDYARRHAAYPHHWSLQVAKSRAEEIQSTLFANRHLYRQPCELSIARCTLKLRVLDDILRP